MKKMLMVFSVFTMMIMGCSLHEGVTHSNEYTSTANPAALYCIQQNGFLDTVTENASRTSYCILPDNDRVELWEHYHMTH
ncbi:putative hemolysin [Vibrio sagamiensis]|uniref:Hemolysin n=1 Tax=Vibrio sagamiensis NBRC 104589 TaxID=1219064 RepID=A0A511QD51_9VIBR|nr:DUF333 domain-containing protein [Vibrio sagamiensis]PNQ66941.1 DUF333 domain-containing protein [Vibrio agarivorans]GEM75234.1 hypothetical protein VSA01S_13460 [Vibrio sagamiensis NBRC 104589]